MNRKNGNICPNMLIFRCVAHFMGRKAPGSSIDCIECVQKPLCEIYNSDPCSCLMKDIARDVHLLIFTSGIYAIPINPIDPKIWIPMQNFQNCAAVKGVMGNGLSFRPLNSPETACSALPAIFTVIASRGNCVPLLDCYIFSCTNNESALTLVENSRLAFGDRKGWSSNLKPPPVSMLDIADDFTDEKWHCKQEETLEFREPINPELYQKPSLHGFYYAPKTDIIRSFDIGLEAEAYPLPNIENPPIREPACPQYLIINQQEEAIAEQPQQPPQQPDLKCPTPNGYFVTSVVQDDSQSDPYNMTKLVEWLPHHTPPARAGTDTRQIMVPGLLPPAYSDLDSSMVIPIDQPQIILPATGYYPAMFGDQAVPTYFYQNS